jgi:ClpP class serine protease
MSTRTTNEKRERLLRKLARLDHSDPAATDVDRRIAMLRRDEAVEVDRQMRRVLADDVREKMHRIELDAIAERLRQLKRDDRVYQAAGLSSAVAGNVGVLRLYGSIGGDYQDGISAEMFALALDNLGPVQQISVWVNSPGGNVFDGLSMYNLLRRHPAAVHVKVDGIAASAASIVACAADKGCLTLGAASCLDVDLRQHL